MGTSAIGSPMLKARVPMFLDVPDQVCSDIALMEKTAASHWGAADELERSR